MAKCISLHTILLFPCPYADLWPIRFELMASLGIIKRLSKSPDASIGGGTLAEELEIVSVESDGLCELLDGLEKVSFFSWSLLHGLANTTKGTKKETENREKMSKGSNYRRRGGGEGNWEETGEGGCEGEEGCE